MTPAIARRGRHTPRPFTAPAAVLAALTLAVLVLVVGARLRALRHDLALIGTELRDARGALLAHDERRAARALDRAQARVVIGRDAAATPVVRLLRPLPVVGAIHAAADASLTAAEEAVAAGWTVLAAASSLPTSGTTAIDGLDLSLLHGAAARSADALGQASHRLRAAGVALRGPSAALLPQVARPARAMRAEVERAHQQIESARRGLALLGELTADSSNTSMLVLAQDSLELRPTGGYIGSYGVLTFAEGRVTLETYAATEDLPAPEPQMTPPAELAPFLPEGWRLSNVNWSPDFPTTGAAAREMFRRQGGGVVDGVLALTDLAVARLTGALGPLAVPGYAEPVTEEGFSQRLVHEVELKRPLDVPRKRFLIELAKVMIARLFELPAEQVPLVARAVDRSVSAGDIQLWFADERRQRQLRGTAVEGRLPAPGHDVLAVVDANLSASKANLGLSKHIRYRVSRDPAGGLLARVTIVVENAAPPSPVNPYYHGHLRVYAPQHSRLLSVRPGQRAGPATEGPYEVFSQRVLVRPSSREEVTFDYALPPELARTDDYELTWVRQPGTPRDVLEAAIDGDPVAADTSHRTFRVRTHSRR